MQTTHVNTHLSPAIHACTWLIVARLSRGPDASLAAILRCRVTACARLSPATTSFGARPEIGPSAVHCYVTDESSRGGKVCIQTCIHTCIHTNICTDITCTHVLPRLVEPRSLLISEPASPAPPSDERVAFPPSDPPPLPDSGSFSLASASKSMSFLPVLDCPMPFSPCLLSCG